MSKSKYEYDYPYNLLVDVFGGWGEDINDDSFIANQELTLDQKDGLDFALDTLTEREKHCVILKYRENKTLEEIGKEYNVTRERIRQVIAKATRKLRHPSRANYIRKGYRVASGIVFDKALEYWIPEIAKAKEYAERKIAEYKELAENVGAEMPDDRLETDIADLELSVRSYNCLRRAGLNTIGDIVNLEDGQRRMMRVRNLGRKSLEEVYARLREHGYKTFADGTPMAIPLREVQI